MADYNSTYTGAEVDASVAKSQGIPSATDVTSAVNKALALAPATDINEAIQPAAASAGDVWTADGDGGAAWVAPSGGGGGKYAHNIVLVISSEGCESCQFTLINAVATPYNSYSAIASALNNAGFDSKSHVLSATGHNTSAQSPYDKVESVFSGTGTTVSYGRSGGGTAYPSTLESIQDIVIAL